MALVAAAMLGTTDRADAGRHGLFSAGSLGSAGSIGSAGSLGSAGSSGGSYGSYGAVGSSGGSYGSVGSLGSDGSLGSYGSVGDSSGSLGSSGSSGGIHEQRRLRRAARAERRAASHGSDGSSGGSYGSYGSTGGSSGGSYGSHGASVGSDGGSYGASVGYGHLHSAAAAPAVPYRVAARPAPVATDAQDGNFAYVVVTLPEDATLILGGNRTTSTGEVRKFKIPVNEAGQHSYSVRVELVRDGQNYVAESTETLVAGKTVSVKVNDVATSSDVQVANR